MRELLRFSLTLIVALCTLSGAEPARAGNSGTVTISASVVKPLTLSRLQDLDLGSIVLGPGTWSGATVAISRAGTLTCSNVNVTCSGATRAAMYNVTGSNKSVVQITAPNVILTNQSDPTKTLTLTIDNPGSVVLTSSGAPGDDFSLGGAINLNSNTAGGIYTGTFNVTVDY